MKSIFRFIYKMALAVPAFAFSFAACAQPPVDRAHCKDEAFDQKVARTISFSIPTMGVDELKANLDAFVVLDAREEEEYALGHIPGARFVGYKSFDPNVLKGLGKDTPIVLYCSIGYRSEKIGEKLQALGFTQVQNLYGSVFEWVNQGYALENGQGQKSNKVHTYNEAWSKWVKNPQVQKVW